MEDEWLTEELDKTPYFYNKEEFDSYVKKLKIEEKKAKFLKLLNENSILALELNSSTNNSLRYIRNFLSFLAIDDDKLEDFDITNLSEEQTKKILAYRDACAYAHKCCQDPEFRLHVDFFIKLHSILCSGDPDKNLLIQYRLRGPKDRAIIIGQGYFNPVEGENVRKRVFALLNSLYLENKTDQPSWQWANDPTIIKAVKFATEYIRIQPHMDANKRMALIMLSCILDQEGYPELYLNRNQKDELYNCIKTSILTRDVTDFGKFVAKNVNRCLDDYLDKIDALEVNKSINMLNAKHDRSK